MNRLLPEVVGWLETKLSPRGILARHDVRARSLEGLEQTVEVLRGEVPQKFVIRDRAIEYEVKSFSAMSNQPGINSTPAPI